MNPKPARIWLSATAIDAASVALLEAWEWYRTAPDEGLVTWLSRHAADVWSNGTHRPHGGGKVAASFGSEGFVLVFDPAARRGYDATLVTVIPDPITPTRSTSNA